MGNDGRVQLGKRYFRFYFRKIYVVVVCRLGENGKDSEIGVDRFFKVFVVVGEVQWGWDLGGLGDLEGRVVCDMDI